MDRITQDVLHGAKIQLALPPVEVRAVKLNTK